MPQAIPLFGTTNAVITPSVAIAVCALLFTVGSFWWIQVRRGALRSYPPLIYSAVFSHQKTMIVLPLIVHNPAPASLAVVGMRLVLDVHGRDRSGSASGANAGDMAVLPRIMGWNAYRSDIYGDSGRTFAAPFAVEGRKAVEKFVEFQWDDVKILFEHGPYRATVEVNIHPRPWWRRREWRELVSFDLNTQLSEADPSVFVTRNNDPEFGGPPTRTWNGQ
jgi:hypothetical protein